MKKLSSRLLWVAIFLVVIFSVLNIFLVFKLIDKQELDHDTNAKSIKSIVVDNHNLNKQIEELKVVIASIPKDIKNGKDGRNGKDGKSIVGEKGKKGDSIIGEKGSDGLTPDIRCNILKNRWEIRYDIDPSWKLLGGEPVKCTVLETIND